MPRDGAGFAPAPSPFQASGRDDQWFPLVHTKDNMMDPSTFNEYQRQRYAKLQELREQGLDPFPPRARRTT